MWAKCIPRKSAFRPQTSYWFHKKILMVLFKFQYSCTNAKLKLYHDEFWYTCVSNRKLYHTEFMSKWDLYHGEFWWKAVLILKILLRYLPHLHHPLRWDQLHFPVTDTNVMYNHYRYITHFFGENNCVCVAEDYFFTTFFLKKKTNICFWGLP